MLIANDQERFVPAWARTACPTQLARLKTTNLQDDAYGIGDSSRFAL